MYHVYILRCSDNSLYTGYTTDVEVRVRAHNMGFGSAHTYKRLPVELLYSEAHPTRLSAVRRERQLKGWSRKKKEALIREDLDGLHVLAKRRARLPLRALPQVRLRPRPRKAAFLAVGPAGGSPPSAASGF
jgi:predicted GIY-YIG superfamily endonuclease